MGLRGPKSKYANQESKLLARRQRYHEKKFAQASVNHQDRKLSSHRTGWIPHSRPAHPINLDEPQPQFSLATVRDHRPEDHGGEGQIPPIPLRSQRTPPRLRTSRSPSPARPSSSCDDSLSALSATPGSPERGLPEGAESPGRSSLASSIHVITPPESPTRSDSDSDIFVETTSSADTSPEKDDGEPLSVSLARQLLRFQGCCRDCHAEAQTIYMTRRESDQRASLAEIIQWSCPEVLSVPKIMTPENNWREEWSAASRHQLYCGADPSPSSQPYHVELQMGQEKLRPTDISFDIDSVTAFLSSLAAARLGIRWYPVQRPISDLQSGLQLEPLPVRYTDAHGRTRSRKVPIHQIKHYTLCRVVGFEEASIYVVFPGLYRPGQTTSRLQDRDFQVWMDEILLPALDSSGGCRQSL
jgi:hypothetical protein